MHICEQCHLIGNGCCFVHENDIQYMFGLTFHEINRIIQFTGMEQSDFTVSDNISNDFFLQMKEIDEIFDNIFYKKFRIRLKVRNGTCIFLTTVGCLLPEEFRPFYCRLYPFWADEVSIFSIGSENCLALRNKSNLQKSIDMVGTNISDIIKLHNEYLHVSREHKIKLDAIINERF